MILKLSQRVSQRTPFQSSASQHFFFATLQSIDPKKDYYGTLGIQSTSSDKEIKSAFYKLAKQYHPDVYKGSHDKIKEVNEAYEVLGDKAKKQEYDQMRKAAASSGYSFFRNGQQQQGSPFSYGQQQQDPYRKNNKGYDPSDFKYYYEARQTQQGNPNQSYYYQQQKYYDSSHNFHSNQQQQNFNSQFVDQAFKEFINNVYQKQKQAEQRFKQSTQQQYYNQGQNNNDKYYYTDSRQYQNQADRYSNFDRNAQQGSTQYQNRSSNYQSEYNQWNQQNDESFKFYKQKMEEYKREELRKQQEYEQWRKQREDQFVKEVEEKVENIKQKAQDFGNKLKSAKKTISSFFSSK